MWSKVEAWGSEHPVALGFIVFAIGALLLYLFTAGKSSAAAETTTGDGGASAYYAAQTNAAASGNTLAAYQAQAQADTAQAAAALAAYQTSIGGQVDIARIVAQSDLDIATINAGTDRMAIAADAQTAQLASTLTAQTTGALYDRDVLLQRILSTADVDKAYITSQTALGEAAYNATTKESSYQAQYQTAVSDNAAKVALAQIGAASDVVTAGAGQGIYGAVLGSSAFNYLAQTQPYGADAVLLQQGLAQNKDLTKIPLPTARSAPLLDISTSTRYF